MDDTALRIRGLTKAFRSFTLGPLDVTVPTPHGPLRAGFHCGDDGEILSILDAPAGCARSGPDAGSV